jgi:adenylate cyclase
MKYRTKLYSAFIFLIFCTTLVGVTTAYQEARRALFQEFRSKVLTIAVTTAGLIDGDQLALIQEKEDANNPRFQALFKQLRSVRDGNKNDFSEIAFVYAIRPSKKNNDKTVMVVDGREGVSDYKYPGDLFTPYSGFILNEHFSAPWASREFVVDYTEPVLSAYAPVFTSDKRYAGTIGVDLSAASVMRELNHLKLISFIGLVFTLIGGFLAANFLTNSITKSLDRLSKWVSDIGKGDFETRLDLETGDEFGKLAHALNKMTHDLGHHERLKTSFVRYVSQHVMDQIFASKSPPVLTGERRNITVLSSDLRSFTSFSEQYPAEQVVSLLNDYFDRMLTIIFDNQGTLDKFIGDGMLVVFGAPVDDPLQQDHAIKTAVQMQIALKELHKKWMKKGWPALGMGIGIHTGAAVVGNIGSDKRMDYTSIGDTVNVAFRLEEATRTAKANILVSEAVVEKLRTSYIKRKVGPLTLSGRESPVVAYTIEVN